jgi:hypothetical protein
MWFFLAISCVSAPDGLRLSPRPADTRDDLVVSPAAPEGEVLVYRWSVDGIVQPDLAGNVVPASRTSRGQRWAVAVEGASGQRRSSAVQLAVEIGNAPPEVRGAIVSTSDGLSLSVEASDPDGDAVSLAWVWTSGEEQIVGGGVPKELLVGGQVWEVAVDATDGIEAAPTLLLTTAVGDQPPTLFAARITPDPATAADTLSVIADVTDPDGDEIDLQVTWLINGVAITDELALGPGIAARGDTVTALVTATDGLSRSVERVTPALRITNSVPSVAFAMVEPAELSEGLAARCVVVGWSDADDDEQAIHTRWFVNGILKSESDAINGANFAKGDEVSCSATPFDPESAGEAVYSSGVPVINTPPSLSQAIILPSRLRAGDQPTASIVGAFDPDGDLVDWRVQWILNGLTVGNDDPLDVPLRGGDALELRATPFDGEVEGSPIVSEVATVLNTAPTVLSAHITPDPPVRGHPVGVDVDAFDADGDPVVGLTVRWKLPGLPVITSPFLDGEYVTPRTLIEAEVIVDDGRGSSLPFNVEPVEVP